MYNVDLKGCGMGVTQEVVFVQGLRMLGLLSASTAASDFAEGFSEHFKGMLQLVPHFFDREDQFSGSWTGEGMGNPRLSLNATPNSMNVYMDTGNPQLNCTLDSVLKISGIGAAHAATQEAYSLLKKEVPTTKCDLERIVKKAGREGLQWGMVAGIYAGIEYGMERARGKQDWKNAAVGGVVTGAMLSVSDGIINQDKMVRTALTAGALATAADLLKFF
ncbi:outer envelope pore protein 16, chloroplastic isoform X2 [Physcomitrium patens]|uniref:outer envelope pore protein 16, chloroplastic isoform X2 n=1 Tax=Physcomitrium patens TaxID=3218 RepID=UPI000D158C74|nr:outer envelope pore protein 16, chloroplastic-like isoform X2 [Physcomitrium patens]|eukprot:XP_024372692.1 outer envelope pore protein 16, chloroplastic-like isoform X2 [Physcomitrella patens]